MVAEEGAGGAPDSMEMEMGNEVTTLEEGSNRGEEGPIERIGRARVRGCGGRLGLGGWPSREGGYWALHSLSHLLFSLFPY